MTTSVELFVSPYCRCAPATRRQARTCVQETAPDAAWSEINVLDELERAVSHGIRTKLAIAVNGRVVTCGRLDLEALQAALEADHDRQHR